MNNFKLILRQYLSLMKAYSIDKKILFIVLALLALFLSSTNQVYAQDFVVVIDAGHGGRDPGAVGKISREKNINLKVALKVGELITKNCPDVKVIYTRKTDVFIPLDKRAQIANNAKADLFISIHTNSVGNSRAAKGASTWTLGLAKTKENLEVAKRENGVILYENDYETTYAGFDPNSAESYIIFEFMQDKYMEQSVHLASLVQKEFKNRSKRIDRGVHQAEFLVLKNSAMPSILVELGFISNPEEEKYLNTEAGTNSLSNSIYQAFLTYKKEQPPKKGNIAQTTRSSSNSPTPREKAATPTQPATKPATTTSGSEEPIIFKVQFLTASTVLKKGDKRLKGIQNFDYYKEKGIYKYTCGASEDYNKVLRTRREMTAKFSDAFIVAFRGDKKLNINQAIEEFKKKKK